MRKGEGEGTASLGAWLVVELNSRVRERERGKKGAHLINFGEGRVCPGPGSVRVCPTK